ncbi:MAG: hypothetical protein JWP74_1157 [Marmoricola sp.]|nr:hypothetical protein [Marmoricola sp.]
MTLPRIAPGSRSGLLVTGLVTILLALLLPLLGDSSAHAAGTHQRSATAAEPATPLTVQLVRLSPSTLPTHGKVVLAGTVRNDSDETWTAVNVDPFISAEPMTTRDQLATAAASDPATYVGPRLTDDFAAIGDLAPGETTPFRIAVPVKDLPISGADGVYWIGVHALGQNAAGRDTVADGRARTFIPKVSAATKHTSVAVVVPIRERVRRDPAGRLLGIAHWAAALAPNGRLGRIGAFLASAGALPVTLLVDPAVLDAVTDITHNNPALSLGTSTSATGRSTPTPSASPSDQASGSSAAGTAAPDPATRANASAWLTEVLAAARAHTTLGLGYADPDVSALARRRPGLLQLATKLSSQTFSGLNLAAVPTVAPPDGWLDDAALTLIPHESMVLVSDHAAPRTRTRWRTTADSDLVFSDAQTESGGPGPTTPTDALALRQRIVSDAALRAGEGGNGPLVVELPQTWDPGPGWQLADFFNGLDLPWLNLVALTPGAASGAPTFSAALGYPVDARRQEITDANVHAARTLAQTSTALSQLLRTKNTIGHDLAGTALDAVSVHARRGSVIAQAQVLATDSAVRATMAKVQVLGTDFVTLSGGSGTLAVTLVNGLDEPITVGIRPSTSTGDVRIESIAPVRMAPGQRSVIRLKASASTIGVTQVTLTPVTSDGQVAGTALTFSLRTSQVGNLIWAVLGAGGLLLVVMISLRIRRGLREHRFRRVEV